MRLNKYLSDAGICSRREADRLIEAGRVEVDQVKAVPGMQVEETCVIRIDGKKIEPTEKKVLLAFHKPRGVECTADTKVKNNVISYVNYPVRVYYAGRLDKDSQGLLLLTNRGELANEMMKAGNFHEKEYEVTVDKPVTDRFISRMSRGVPILGTITRECRVWKTGERSFSIVLTQGLNRQIRRMCEYLGYRVVTLKRVRIMNIRLGDLPVGGLREIKGQELELLEKTLKEKPLVREVFRGGKPVKNPGNYRTPGKKMKSYRREP